MKSIEDLVVDEISSAIAKEIDSTILDSLLKSSVKYSPFHDIYHKIVDQLNIEFSSKSISYGYDPRASLEGYWFQRQDIKCDKKCETCKLNKVDISSEMFTISAYENTIAIELLVDFISKHPFISVCYQDFKICLTSSYDQANDIMNKFKVLLNNKGIALTCANNLS
jgi:hypothetical protein